MKKTCKILLTFTMIFGLGLSSIATVNASSIGNTQNFNLAGVISDSDNINSMSEKDNNTVSSEKSVDSKAEIKNIRVQVSAVNDGDTDVPPDYPVVIKFDSDIDVVDNSKITLKGGDKNYPVKSSVYDGMLVIEHDDLPYDSSFTLNIEPGAVNNSAGTLYNDKYTVSFNTGKEFNRLQGIDRYATSISVSQKWSSSEYAVLASGEDFADALSAAPLAKEYEAPILLTTPKTLMPNTEAELSRLGVKKVFIIGGNASVSKEIEDKLSAKGIEITRLSGLDRYETSLAVANYIGTDNGEMFVVSGVNFPDALSIASYAAYSQTPIILTDGVKLSEGIQNFVKTHDVNKTHLIGGSGVVSEDVASKLPNAERIGGLDRYETNLKVLENFEFYYGATMFASGQGFADALSGSALAALSNSPIILMDEDMINRTDITSELASLKSDVKMKWIIGGEGVIPSSVVYKVFK